MNKRIFRDVFVSALIMVVTFLIGHYIHESLKTDELVSSLFVLAVFLISVITRGYLPGIISALVSVLAVNYAFKFPYFEFNFTIPENLLTTIIMILITVVTSALTTKLLTKEKIELQAEKEQMRGNLLRAISHDLRTPLTAIYGASSTVIDNYENLTDESKLDMLTGIKEDSQWLIRMVENLLSVTKIGNNNVTLTKTSVVLEELIDSVLDKFKSRYPEQNVKVTLPEDFVTILCDPLLIEQVLVNILENAVQHAEGMTKLWLNILVIENRAIFNIIDDGCGVDEEKLKNLFTGDIVSGSVSYDSNKQNMGIGLSVCSTIIKAHDGVISARNNKDKGMTFTFGLDVEEE